MKYNISWRAVDSGKWQIEGGSITSYLPNNSIVRPASVTVTAAFVRNQTILQNKSTSIIQAWSNISRRESIIQAWYWQIPRSR